MLLEAVASEERTSLPINFEASFDCQ